jgi:hypothetical protein
MEILAQYHKHPMVQEALWRDRNLLYDPNKLTVLRNVAESYPNVTDFPTFKAMVDQELFDSGEDNVNVFVARDQDGTHGAAAQTSGINLAQAEARMAEVRRQLPLLEQQYEQGREQAQRALVARHQLQEQIKELQDQIKALESRKMMLHADIAGTQRHNLGLAPRGPTGLHQAQTTSQQHVAIPTDDQSQAAGLAAIIDLSAGEQQRQSMALGAGMLEARPTENVRRGQVEQVERQQPRAPAAVDDLRFREERTRQMDEELINRIQDRAEDEADAVDDTAFNPLKQWQSPNVFPQVAQYGDDKGDNDMFNEPMVLD